MTEKIIQFQQKKKIKENNFKIYLYIVYLFILLNYFIINKF